MILAYNLSPKLTKGLKEIDKLRAQILLLPLSPRTEIRLRWEAIVSRVYWSLVMSDNSLTKNQMAKLLASNKSRKLTKQEGEVINYKLALSHIQQEWLVTGRQVTVNSLQTLYNIACKETVGKAASLSSSNKKELNTLFEYLRSSNEHPTIQAGIAQVSIIQKAPYDEGNGRMARLIPYLYLYKYGFDCRGLLVIDEYLRRDLVGLNLAVESVRKNQNLTVWLEYFVEGCLTQLKKSLENAEETRFSVDVSAAYTKLNSRQKEILDILDAPDAKISNKVVQDKFKVSQITASRDLSKMHELDLILVHGKGRSTYYTKA